MFDYVFKRKKTWFTVFLLDLIGSLLFLFRSKEPPRVVQRILVIRLDHLGDVAMSTPFFSKLRELYPAAEIHLLIDSNYADLFDGDSRFDYVIPVENHWLSRKGPVRWLGHLKRVLELRRYGYDLGFDLRGDFRTIFFFLFLVGVKYRVAYGIRGGGFLLNQSPLYPRRSHEIDRNLNLLASFSNKNFSGVYPSLEVDQEIKKRMGIRLEKLGRITSKKLIAVHVGAGYPSKQWGEDKFQKVIEALLDQGIYQVCLLGKKGEINLPQDFIQQDGILSCLESTSIKELVALISLCDFFIGNDSGPAHVAASVGIPVLSVFSGTNRFDEFMPITQFAEVIHKDMECSPCEEKLCPLGHHHCMELITEDEVIDGFQTLASRVENSR